MTVMGMAAAPPPILPSGGCGQPPIRQIIKMRLEEAAASVMAKADPMMLAPGKPVRSLLAWPEGSEGHGMALMVLPDDCLRLIDVKLSDWRRPATIIAADDPLYLLQSSAFEGVRGNPENPVAAVCRRPAGLVAELYSSRSGRGVCIETAQYIPLPRFTHDGFISLPESLYHEIINATAQLTAESLGMMDVNT